MFNWIKSFIRYWVLLHRFTDSTIYFGAVVDKNSRIGENSVVFKNTVLQNSSLGDYSYIQKSSTLSFTHVGNFCSIASNVYIGLVDHPTGKVSTSPVFYDDTQPLPFFFKTRTEAVLAPIVTLISSDVWIGNGVMIKAGVKIGVGAIVGAGAVVTADVKAYSVVVGVPAKHIRWRFGMKTCKQLLNSEWWLLNKKEIESIAVTFDNPVEMLRVLSKIKKK